MNERRESEGFENFPILTQLDEELREEHVPEILKFVNGMIPRTEFIPSVDLIDVDGRPIVNIPAIKGPWHIRRNTTHVLLGEEWTRNDRGTATIIKGDERFSTLVAIEQYFDRIEEDSIQAKPIRIGSTQNDIFGDLVGNGVVDLMRDSQGFGLIPPQDLPKVLKNMRSTPDLFGELLDRWESWNVF